MNTRRKYLLTGAIVLIALVMILLKYGYYIFNPWTRNGQVRAEVIQVTPRVSGPIVRLPVNDNQFVKAGDLLFEIDPRTFKASLEQAQAQYDKTGDDYQSREKQVEAAEAQVKAAQAAVRQAQANIKQQDSQIIKDKAEYQRQQEMMPKKATSQKAVDRSRANYEVSVEQRAGALAGFHKAQATVSQAEAALAEARANLGATGDANASIREARAAVRQAELNLEFTQSRAPVDGYVTNLNLRLGTQAVTNQPALALVDVASFWIDGFFKENSIANMQSGDLAVVTLMTYPDDPIEGRVDSIGWGIAQQDGSTGFELLPNVSPTFEWIRLAQRVPVRIRLTDVPDDVALRVGTTCSVLVMTDTADEEGGGRVAAAPKILQ